MSTKDDRDNRSNQLNPNNAAYWSSRASDDCDAGDEGESQWIQQDRREQFRQAEERTRARFALTLGCLDLDLVGTNGRWVRLRCGEGAIGFTRHEALGSWFEDCMTAFQEEWGCEIAYAQLYEDSCSNNAFLRRPDCAGVQMSQEAETGLAALRTAGETNQPRVHPILSHRGPVALVCVVEKWPPTLAELRTAPRGRILQERAKSAKPRKILRVMRGQSTS